MTRAKDFIVTITTWEGPSEFECIAVSADNAKKQARAWMRDYCGHDRHCGKATYRARVA